MTLLEWVCGRDAGGNERGEVGMGHVGAEVMGCVVYCRTASGTRPTRRSSPRPRRCSRNLGCVPRTFYLVMFAGFQQALRDLSVPIAYHSPVHARKDAILPFAQSMLTTPVFFDCRKTGPDGGGVLRQAGPQDGHRAPLGRVQLHPHRTPRTRRARGQVLDQGTPQS